MSALRAYVTVYSRRSQAPPLRALVVTYLGIGARGLPRVFTEFSNHTHIDAGDI